MKEEGIRLKPMKRKIGELRLADMDEIFQDMRETFDSIARRAYEIFEANGKQLGRDMENWFRAEHELLHPVHLEMRESNNELTVRAEVPGFEAKDIEVSVEPGRLTIAGQREWSQEEKEEKLLYSERRSNQFFRSLNLPVDVDPEKANATLKGGVLMLKLPKSKTARKIRIEPKAA